MACRWLCLLVLAAWPVTAARVEVTAHGAKGDGVTNDTAALQAAVEACAAAGGGEVVLPAGRYLCGSLVLRSRINLVVTPQAVLLGSRKLADFSNRRLLSATDAVDVTVSGGGTIDGQGEAYWEKGQPLTGPDWRGTAQSAYRALPRPQFLYFLRCQRLVVREVTLTGSPSWTLHLQRCRGADICDVRIRNPLYGPNTDGIDLNSCQDVTVRRCDIITGDDGVVLKSLEPGHDHPSARIEVSDCRVWSACNALKIGTETHDDFSDITFRNCHLYGGSADPHERPLAGVAIESVDGSRLSHIVARDLTMDNVRAPLFVRLGHRGGNSPKTQQVEPRVPGEIRDVLFQNIRATRCGFEASISGIPGHPVRQVVLRNVDLSYTGGGTDDLVQDSVVDEAVIRKYPEAQMFGRLPTVGLYVRHAEGLVAEGLTIRCELPDARPRLVADDVSGLTLRGFAATTAPAAQPVLWLQRSRDVTVAASPVPAGARCFAAIEGTAAQHASCRLEAPAGQVMLLPPGGLLKERLPLLKPEAPGRFRIEAEDLYRFTPMVKVADATATGGQCVMVPLGGGRDTGGAACRLAVSEAGPYELWVRVLAPSGESDSYYVSLDNQPALTCDVAQVSADWQWDRARDRVGGRVVKTAAATFELSAGEHVLRWRNREAGTRLDVLVLVRTDQHYQPR